MDNTSNPIEASSSEPESIAGYRTKEKLRTDNPSNEVYVGVDARGTGVVIKKCAQAGILKLKLEAEILRTVGANPLARVPRPVATQDGVLVTTAIPGSPLHIPKHTEKKLRHKPYEIRRFIEDMMQTLTLIHEKGIVHGRVDPSHIIVQGEGRPYYLIGFGHATRQGAAGRYPSRPFTSAGNVSVDRYIAPESRDSAQSWYCGDIFSVGVIAIQLLTGASLTELKWNKDGVVELPLYPSASDPILEHVLKMMTCYQPLQRYQEPDEALRGLITPPAGEILPKPDMGISIRRTLAGLLALAILSALCYVTWRSAVRASCQQSVGCQSPPSR